MMMWIATLASGHGGEDHGAPAAVALDAGASRDYAASDGFEAVFRVSTGETGAPVATTLLLADFATSAPVDGATAQLTLSGPGALVLDFAAAAPGVYGARATFPAVGEYAGALVVTTASASDLLAMAVHIGDVGSAAHDDGSAGWAAAGACTGLALAAGFGILAGGVGYAVGRRRGTAAALALTVGAQQVSAHGGEDHGPPAATVSSAGGGLTLPLESQFLLGLRTMRAVNDTFQDQVQALGAFVARPGESAALRAPVSGVLLAPPGGFPSPGSRVEAGDLLAQIQETPGRLDRAALGQARSDAGTRVAELRAAVTLAERDAAQAESLGGAISERERLERQQAVTVAKEALRQSEGARSAAGGTLAIRAPLGGTLGPIGARPGDQIEAGSALFRVSDVVGLWVEARVPERLALGLTPGAPARVTTDAAPGRVLEATVLDAGQEADPRTGTVLVTLSVQGDDLDVRPGSGARAWIGRGAGRDALTVPDGAIVDSNGASLAFVKTGPEQFEARELALGGRAGGEVEVLSGIRAGERVVIDGTYALRSLAGR